MGNVQRIMLLESLADNYHESVDMSAGRIEEQEYSHLFENGVMCPHLGEASLFQPFHSHAPNPFLRQSFSH